MQREAVLHVNCLLNCSSSHTNSVSRFAGMMCYLNYVGSLKETKYCLFAEIFQVISVFQLMGIEMDILGFQCLRKTYLKN